MIGIISFEFMNISTPIVINSCPNDLLLITQELTIFTIITHIDGNFNRKEAIRFAISLCPEKIELIKNQINIIKTLLLMYYKDYIKYLATY